jgi:microcystin-dependent protein
MKYLLSILFVTNALAASPATIPNDTLSLGKTGAGNKTIEMNLTKSGASTNPKFRWNNSLSKFQISFDGTNYKTINLGSDIDSGSALNSYVLTADGSGNSSFSQPTSLPIGSVFPYAGLIAPTGYFICDGSLVSRTTYASLFAAIGTSFGSGDGSTTFAIPDMRGQFIRGYVGIPNVTGSGSVVTNNATFTSHGYIRTGTEVRLASGTLTGLSTGTTYYVIVINSNTLAFATSKANALAGTKIAISGTNTGVIQNWIDPDASSRTQMASGGNSGDAIGSMQDDSFESHNHTYTRPSIGGGSQGAGGNASLPVINGGSATGDTGGNETRSKNVTMNYIIKY